MPILGRPTWAVPDSKTDGLREIQATLIVELSSVEQNARRKESGKRRV